jgi:hypothetical protein
MKMIRILQSVLVGLVVGLLNVSAWAQNPETGALMTDPNVGCAYGYGQYGYMNCGGGSNGRGAGSSRTQPPKIINRYGAVAMNLNTGFFDSVYNESSRTTAEKSALSKCGSGCILISSYSNQCAAVGFGKAKNGKGGYRGIATNPDSKVAESKALASCNAKANNCQIILSECSKYN